MVNYNALAIAILVIIMDISAGCTSTPIQKSEQPIVSETIVDTISPVATIGGTPTPTVSNLNPYEVDGDKALVQLHCMQGVGTVEDCSNLGVELDRDNGNVIHINLYPNGS